MPLEQVLAKATQDVQGQLGSYDLYYLDQSWVATFAQDTVDPVAYYKDKPDLAMPGFDFEDFAKPLVDGLALYEGKWGGIPFDIPIFVTMYRKDILEKHKIAPPTTVEEFTNAVKMITEMEKGNGMYGTGLQAKSGHYSLNCDWTQMVWNEGGSIFGADKKFTGNDEAAVRGLALYQEWAKNAPPEIHQLHLGRPVADGCFRAGCAHQQLGRILPGLGWRGFQGARASGSAHGQSAASH